MKKILAILLIATTVLTVSCNKKEDLSKNTDINNQKTETDNKKEEKKENVEKIEPKQNVDDKKENENQTNSGVYAIYFENNASIVFDNSISSEDFEFVVSASSQQVAKNGDSFKLKVENGKITGISPEDSLEVQGTYVGLIDASSAQFSYNSSLFSLNVTEEQMNKLEEIPENNLLSLKIEKSDSNNFKLVDFSLK